ncbi:MAG: SH3 domain-containing protein [Actinobacteria bacterium]|nr:SH3 domain-containing protein [Actinomycetota bacterium]
MYLSFHKGDKIVTRQTFDNGWWYGNVLKKPDVMGYFPSNYVKVGTAAPLP